jgi:hypothetical protein
VRGKVPRWDGTPTDTGWDTFPYAANYQAFGNPYRGAQYQVVGNSRVYLRGLITRNTATAPAGSVCGTMPVGARPQTNGDEILVSDISGVHTLVTVNSAGQVIHNVALTVGGFLTLSGLYYDLY